MSWTHDSAKTLIDYSSITHFDNVTKDGVFLLSIVTSTQFICGVKRMRGTGIVTPYSSTVLAHANCIGVKAVFTSE